MNENLNGQQPPQFVDVRQVPVIFDVDAWNIVLTALADAPWKNVSQLIPEIRRQIEAELARRKLHVVQPDLAQAPASP